MSSSPTETTARTVAILMPKIGVSISEGTVLEWLVSPGDRVERDQVVCEVSTDKTDIEIPAPRAGLLERILVEPGETVEVGTELGTISLEASAGAEQEEPGRPDHDAGTESGDEIDRSGFFSPVVRRIASAEGVDLDRVEGHGVGGRVRKQDLLAHLRSRRPGAEAPLHTDSPFARRHREPAPPAADPSNGGSTDIPLEGMRGAIARHMVESRRRAAHCTTVVEADFSAVAADRERRKAHGSPPTYLAYVARAVVAALRRHPILNSTIEDEVIRRHDQVDLGIAVATEDGLLVPVIPSAERLSLEGLAEEIAGRAGRARTGKLGAGESGAGTFTITNPGAEGALIATPIINQPQVAILDLEAVVERPVAVPTDSGPALAIRPMAYLCMSWDHRALDGVTAARFLADVKAGIERGGDDA